MSLLASTHTIMLPARLDDRVGEGIVLREAVRRDAARYREHLARLVAETPFMLQGPEDPLGDLAEHKDLIADYGRRDNSVCIVAVRPGGVPGRSPIVGSVTLAGGHTRRTLHNAELAMGVINDAWGRGIGAMLLDAALTWARHSATLMRVSLQVYGTNVVARSLYDGHGFVYEGTLRRYARWEGRYDDLVGMSYWVGTDGA